MKTFQEAVPTGTNSSRISAGQGAIAQSKWQLLRAVEESREPLGLKGTTIAVLRAMLSFIRSEGISSDHDAHHICFASNATLAQRAHVSIQTVERHIAKLVSLGLVERRASGNGKRWARRDRSGRIVLATGISLIPLVHRHAEFVELALRHDKCQRAMALLRDQCRVALARLTALANETPVLSALRSRAGKMLRRKPDGAALRALLDDISVEIQRFEAQEADNLMASDREIEGHKETFQTPSVEKKDLKRIEVGQDDMQRAFPRLCAELRYAKSAEDCARQMNDIARQLHLGDLWFSVKELGPALSFMVLGYLLERIETIKHPRAYTWTLINGLSSSALNWQTLLKPPIKRHDTPVRNSGTSGKSATSRCKDAFTEHHLY